MRRKMFPAFLVLFFILLATPVFATNKPDTFPRRPSNSTAAAQAQDRLTEAKAKACQARENAITKRMAQLTRLVTTITPQK
jgi:hypothetical protein